MRPITIASLLILCLLIVSCKKDDSSGANRSAQLNCRIIQDETIFNNDTSYKSVNKFYYSGDLLIRRTGGNKHFVNNEQTYHYDQQGRLSFILISYTYNSSIDTINKFKYNNLGQLTQISSYDNGTIYATANFKYTGSKLSEMLSVYNNNIDTEKFSIISDNKNNIIEAQLIQLNSQNINNGAKYLFTYDNYKNPYQGMYDEYSSIIEYFGSNNLTQIEHYENGALKETTSNSYNYNQHLYPTSISDNDPSYPSFKTLKYECF